MKPTSYRLMNVATGRVFDDAGWTMGDPEGGSPSLVRAVYENKRFTPRDDLDGIYRYAEWMPIKRTLRKSCAPVTYKSKGLARYLGLENLYITFSGWNPRIGAKMRTCSFKETEAYSVLARMDAREKRILVVQSAGNTARAFAQVCSDNRIPIVICVPEDNLHDLWFRRKLHPCVKLVAAPHGCDYYDAITLGEKLASDPRYMLEGGAKNVARRDGMGTTLLSCVEQMGRIPDAYFQAVGSGTGAIAAWENACRLGEDGRFGENKMRVYVAQNEPFTLMYDSWQAGSRALVDLDPEKGRHEAEVVLASVLSNRKPPYSLAGGLFDTLKASGGDFYTRRLLYRDQQRDRPLDAPVPQPGGIRPPAGGLRRRDRPGESRGGRHGGQGRVCHAQLHRRRRARGDVQGIRPQGARPGALPGPARRRGGPASEWIVLKPLSI